MARLRRAFYARDTLDVAREVLGKVLVRELPDGTRRAGRIVETEAYHGPDDQASHARRGPTPRAAIMFGRPGVAYVYQIYGMFFCLNLVTMDEGFPAAVLVRALEPVDGIDLPTDGPGKLCKAMAIDRSLNGHDLSQSPLWIEERKLPPPGEIIATPRVNVDYAGDHALRPWRFFVAGCKHVSRRNWRGPVKKGQAA